MSVKWYLSCIITPAELGFFIQFPSGNQVLIKDAQSFADCPKWIDRQLARLAIQRVIRGK